MSKGETTQGEIVKRAACLFNRRGYAAASMSEVMAETGLQKGGIYNHFSSKQDLALAAFDYSSALVGEAWKEAIGDHQGIAALRAMIESSRRFAVDPPVPGGCPFLNAGAESDDTHPLLLARVREALGAWESRVQGALELAVAQDELVPHDTGAFASLLVATIEGMFLLEGVFKTGEHAARIAAQLLDSLERLRPA